MDETRTSGRVTRRGMGFTGEVAQQLRGKLQATTTASPKPTASRIAKATSSAQPPVASRSRRPVTASTPTTSAEREEWIRVAAYYRAERRGFTPGHELEDWYAAEAGLSAAPRRSRTRKPATESRAAR